MPKRNKSRQNIVDAAKRMPPLLHKFPNEEFDIRRSRVLWWLVKQPAVLQYIWNLVKQSGAIVYDPNTRKWSGVDFVREEDDS